MTDKKDIVGDALESTKAELSQVDREKHLVKAVKMLDSVEGSINEKEERFKDWYSLHFPEFINEIEDIEHIAKILDSNVQRTDLNAFKGMAENSNGADMTEKEEEIIQKVLNNLQSDIEIKSDLEAYIEELVKDEMPNLDRILGTFLAARMVALAGGLEEMAKKPASTVQMLGAEKALFRYLRGTGTPPKHGVLFEHEYVNQLPEDKRGTMARFIANKAVMAARVDCYSDKEKGDEYREEIQKKFEQLNEA